MAVKKGLIFDTTEFIKDFDKLVIKQYPQYTKKGMFAAMARLKRDADDISPKTPKDKKKLKDSGEPNAEVTNKEITGTVTYKAKYAAYQHEGQRSDGSRPVRNYTEPGSNKKYLEAKLKMFPNRYMKIITAKIKSLGGF